MNCVHTPAPTNPNWPLCREAEARRRGWTTFEIEDGELPDDPIIHGGDIPETYKRGVAWFTARPADCRDCLELVHA